jgi:hypothetical protein
MKTTTHCYNYRIYNKNRIYKHVHVHVDVVQTLGVVSMLYL